MKRHSKGRPVVAPKNAHSTGSDELATRIETYLSRLDVASTYWPGDAEVEKALKVEAAYKRYKRGRLRIFLEAVEDHLRGYTGAAPSQAGGSLGSGIPSST